MREGLGPPDALEYNPHASAFLLGKKKMPKQPFLS